MVNLNNFMGRLYTPIMGGDPNAASGTFDWLEMARREGVNNIGTEDWFSDAAAFQWSYYATKLRSASDLTRTNFGGLIVPRVGGQRPGGLPQKIMTLVGHGAKVVEFFTFGPEYNFPVNCYSENPEVFKPLSEGMRLVGKSEDLIFPGKQRKPEVAILSPQCAQLWDAEGEPKPTGLADATNGNLYRAQMGYMSETTGLALMMQHQSVPVQFVDEIGLSEETLNNYKVLYVTAPDLPQESVQGILEWVRNGGTLVTTAGAGLFDRYHQPTSTLANAAGAVPTTALRMPIGDRSQIEANGTINFNGAEIPVFGDREKLNLKGAQVLASFDDGSPALTSQELGQGRILHLACYSGISYVKTINGDNNGLPTGFSPAWRDLMLQPIRDQKISLPVTLNTALVEAPALYSDKGVAVTLLNWTGAPKPLEVSVAVDNKVTKVESAQKGKVEFQQANGRVTAKLEVGDVDVLKVYY
jgi:hypothetical protein